MEMIEMENTNWQIRINIFDNQNNAYKIIDAINKLELGYDIRILNIDKGDSEYDDEIQGCCTACGRMDSNLYDHVCDKCLMIEKAERQAEEDKYPDETYMIEWGHVAYCSQCNLPAAYDADDSFWYCPEPDCDNEHRVCDVNCCGSKEFNVINVTKNELKEMKKEFSFAEWI